MAAITLDGAGNGRLRSVRRGLRIDMTPMVDLGFLLITFFIFTTRLGEQQALKLVMPADGPATPRKESAMLSVVLSDKGVYAYHGAWDVAQQEGRVQRTSLATGTGLGVAIRTLQQQLRAQGREKELMLLVKPAKSSSYDQVVNALDLALIYGLKHYTIVDADAEEEEYLAKL
ncbi:biopolymer transporter ExbD [Flaviaesturariibacter amylovorans]|uniref:Biopolymer transporter ExbD n=1 Tax=Flaviaesturariibacter amylovorans TaxID=1084520 RepID=A0ABP8HFY9_9BACT